jgi:hypothetical protein
MRKFRFRVLFFCLLFIPAFSQAQFNSDAARKSIVRIYVRVPGESTQNVCTGFMWKQTNNIVTSLHAMKAGAKITIVYPGKELRPAKIIKIITDPDLVMLETCNSDGSPLTLKTDAVPLTSFATSTKNEVLHALGFWSDAASSQVIDLKHADFDPEKLDGILPEQYKKQIIEMTFPSLSDPIYGLNGGSLLPGFSGSPVFNSTGNLVSVGDGGIEAGQLNVSWSIPATNIDRLSASSNAELPSTITHVPFLYSAEASIPIDTVLSYYKFFKHDSTSLYQVKTRNYEQIKKTAWDPYFIEKVEKSIKFFRTKLDYDTLKFDVYQIPGQGTVDKPGFVVTIPAGANFYYDSVYHCIGVNLKKDTAFRNFGLYYFRLKAPPKKKGIINALYGENAATVATDMLNANFGSKYGGFRTSNSSYYVGKNAREMVRNSKFAGGWQTFDGNYESNYLLRSNDEPVKIVVRANVLFNKDEIFCTVLTEIRTENFGKKLEEKSLESIVSPTDCVHPTKNNCNYCNEMKAKIMLNSAVVLTTVNTLY